jgi:hypothetical protein
MSYKRRSRKVRNAARAHKKPRPSAKRGQTSRTSRRVGTKAKYRKGSATWCRARGIPAWGEGQSRGKKAGQRKSSTP